MPANYNMASTTEPPDLNQQPSLTRWSFQDFENAYENKFASGRVNFSDGNAGPQETNVLEGNGATTEEARLNNGQNTSRADKKIYSSGAIYERRLKKENHGGQLSNGQSNGQFIESGPAKALPEFASEEMRELAETIKRDIVTDTTDVGWHTIKGLENAKRILKEAVVMPIKYPQYFTGLLTPWKGILLFGPPGTGKTMLAKAVASECNTTFFNISASSIISKWRGDSEKLVRVLFELAHYYAPSTIFMDEIDAIISQRGENRSEHEASRRLKTELLVQMDGLAKSEHLVFLLAATNIPWELDAAMLRRLEKRILVPLPEPRAREAMFKSLLPSMSSSELPYDLMVQSTDGYSGSDIRIVCKEAAMRPLRRLISKLEAIEATKTQKEETSNTEKPALGAITEDDVQAALRSTRPSAHMIAARYEQFDVDFGSHTIS